MVPFLGDFPRLANLRRWFVAANDCQLHLWLRPFGMTVQKFNPRQRLFEGFLAQLQCVKSSLERPGLTPLRGSFGDSVLLGLVVLRPIVRSGFLRRQNPGITQAFAHRRSCCNPHIRRPPTFHNTGRTLQSPLCMGVTFSASLHAVPSGRRFSPTRFIRRVCVCALWLALWRGR
jgi:hypothetical protein